MKKIFIPAGTVILLLLFVSLAFAAEKALWVTAAGEAYQGETEIPKEVMERAKRDAQSKAIEQVSGVFLKSHTLVHNSQVADGLIYAAVRGKINEMIVLNSGWDKQNRNLYQIRIKALVEPLYPEKGKGLSANLNLSKTKLREGEKVKIYYETNSDCYIYFFSVAADGSVTLLFPNSQNQENKVEGEKVYEFRMHKTLSVSKQCFYPTSTAKLPKKR